MGYSKMQILRNTPLLTKSGSVNLGSTPRIHVQKLQEEITRNVFAGDDLHPQDCDTDSRTYFWPLESLVGERNK